MSISVQQCYLVFSTVSHTHDDVGWLKTVQGYYDDRVQYILDTIIPALEANSERKFIYVEIAFFTLWWNKQRPSIKKRVHNLVKNGQLQFTLGHWSMPDEATTYYRDLITNGELGMKFLENEFGECGRPLVAWQIDPFGHSKGVAKLYRNMGFDALFLGRIDYLDYKNRTEHKEMEFEWILTDGDSEPEKILTLINSNVYCRDESSTAPIHNITSKSILKLTIFFYVCNLCTHVKKFCVVNLKTGKLQIDICNVCVVYEC